MKTGKLLIFMITISGMVALCSCKDYVEQGVNNNTIESYTITVSSSQWTSDVINERYYYRYVITADANSVVVAYLASGSGEQALPYYSSTSSLSEFYGLATNLTGSSQYIELQYKNIFSPTAYPSVDKTYYIHIIPPGEYAAHPNLDWTDYPAVKEELNLAN